MTTPNAVVLSVVVVATNGCVTLPQSPHALPLRRICADGWPIRILTDKTCPDGICGYSCLPDRWLVPSG